MNEKEINQLINQLRIQLCNEPSLKGKGPDAIDEAIMDIFFEAFTQGEMDRKDLEVLANYLGYELDEEFKNDPTPDPITLKGGKK